MVEKCNTEANISGVKLKKHQNVTTTTLTGEPGYRAWLNSIEFIFSSE